jgi:hypothetical protein
MRTGDMKEKKNRGGSSAGTKAAQKKTWAEQKRGWGRDMYHKSSYLFIEIILTLLYWYLNYCSVTACVYYSHIRCMH